MTCGVGLAWLLTAQVPAAPRYRAVPTLGPAILTLAVARDQDGSRQLWSGMPVDTRSGDKDGAEGHRAEQAGSAGDRDAVQAGQLPVVETDRSVMRGSGRRS